MKEQKNNIISVDQGDMLTLQHLKGAMKFSKEHNTLEAYGLERDLYQTKLSTLVS